MRTITSVVILMLAGCGGQVDGSAASFDAGVDSGAAVELPAVTVAMEAAPPNPSLNEPAPVVAAPEPIEVEASTLVGVDATVPLAADAGTDASPEDAADASPEAAPAVPCCDFVVFHEQCQVCWDAAPTCCRGTPLSCGPCSELD
jgi:ABC-type glycerol-3-phosphate transport system substrate-binding protein